MRKFSIAVLLCAACLCSKAQTYAARATTAAEYTYLVNGQYNAILPGHQLRKSNISESMDFVDGRRTVTIYEFYRVGSANPCAILLAYRKSDGSGINICVPDAGSDSSLWDGYSDQLNKINDTGHALMLVSYALGKYAASH